MNLKVIYSILFLCFSLFAKAQFNKQFIVSGGGQVSVYNETLVYKAANGATATRKGNQTNIGFSAETGYFIFKNLSASYKFTYLLWNDNTGAKFTTKAIRNEIIINKLFTMKNNIYFNIGAAPFYQKISIKESTLSEIENIDHGLVFYTGFIFGIDDVGLLGINYFKTFNNYPSTAFLKPGIEVTYKYVFNKKNKQ